MRIARVVLTTIFAALIASAAARAEPAPGAAEPHAIAVVRLTSAPGDKLIEELCRGMLQDSNRWKVKAGTSAEYVGKLEVARRRGNTELTLIVTKQGKLFVRAHQFVEVEQSVIDGVQQLVAQVTDALDGKPPRVQLSMPERPESSLDPVPPLPRPSRKVRHIDEEGADKRPQSSGDDEDDRHHLDLIAGLEGSFGPVSLNPNSIAAGSQNAFDLVHYAAVFTAPIDHLHGALALHAGTKYGWGSFEIAYQASRWSSGAATLVGPRLAFFPLGAIWPQHKLEVGIDLGYGYSFFNGNSYDMTGTYFALGVTCEYPIAKSFGVVAYYRLFTPFLKNFYYDYSANLSEPVGGATAVWNTFGIGLNWHPTIRW